MGRLINKPVICEIVLNLVQLHLLASRHAQCDLAGYRLLNHVLIHLAHDVVLQATE
jgi:hypothetical protein